MDRNAHECARRDEGSARRNVNQFVSTSSGFRTVRCVSRDVAWRCSSNDDATVARLRALQQNVESIVRSLKRFDSSRVVAIAARVAQLETELCKSNFVSVSGFFFVSHFFGDSFEFSARFVVLVL